MHRGNKGKSKESGGGKRKRPPRGELDSFHGDPPSYDSLIGKKISRRYVIQALLYESSMGNTYLALDEKENKKVAVKFLEGPVFMDGLSVKEITARFNIVHGNVAEVTDMGLYKDDVYFVREYVDGKSLNEFIGDGKRLPWGEVRPIILQACDAFQAVHEQGFMHRSLKPTNIMLTQGNVVKVLGFEFARKIPRKAGESHEEAGRSRFRISHVVGVLSTIAPEQLTGKKYDYDHRVDVYALGSIMYRMLCGSYPFIGDEKGVKYEKIFAERPELPSERAPDIGIPKDVEDLVMWCLKKDPEKRPQSMTELKQAILECNAKD